MMAISPKPQNLNDDQWYYEEPNGIAVVAWVRGEDKRRVVTHIEIPWSMLRRSLARKDNRKQPRKSKP